MGWREVSGRAEEKWRCRGKRRNGRAKRNAADAESDNVQAGV